MKSIKRFFFLLILATAGLAFSFSTFTRTVGDCPPPGKEIQFAKLINANYGAQYEGCDVTTIAKFMNADGDLYPPKKLKNMVTFSVVDQNTAETETKNASSNPLEALAAVSGFTYVGMDKASSDIIFNLKSGDLIKLKGQTYIYEVMRLKKVYFIATSVEKIK